MSTEPSQSLGLLNSPFPQFDGPIPRGAGEALAVGRKSQTPHTTTMTFQSPEVPAGGRYPSRGVTLLADDFCRLKEYSPAQEFTNKMVQSARDTNAVQATIAEMVRRIVERFHPERIILFGSHARGTAGPNSDVDLLVVMQPQGSKRRRAVEIHGLLAGMGVPKDVIVVTPEELEAYRDAPGTVIRTAWQEGKILHDRAA